MISEGLVGSRNKEELMTNMGAIEVDLSPEIVAEIDSLSEPVLEILGDNPDYYESLENTRIR
jgi:diketogulonate reductase-like aldo/keto reductase